MALGDEIKISRNKQGESVGIYFDNEGRFAGFVGQVVVEKYGEILIEKPVVYNGTSKGEVTYYDQKGNLLQNTVISFEGDKDQITLSDGTELKRNKRGERIGLYFDGKGRLVRFVAQTPNPKLERSIDYLFISEWKPRPF
jgi:hypothetical protein